MDSFDLSSRLISLAAGMIGMILFCIVGAVSSILLHAALTLFDAREK